MKKRLSFNFSKRFGVFVSEETPDYMTVTHRKEVSPEAFIELRRYYSKPMLMNEVADDLFETLLASAYETGASSAMDAMTDLQDDVDLNALMHSIPQTKDLLESDDDAPIIRLINAIFTQALKQGASDIHFETYEQKLIVRFRIDGVLREVLQPPRVIAPLIVSRLKVMAKLDIAEKRLPQDGRLSLKIAGRNVDVRVSTIPTHYGERIVLRLLDKQSTALDFKKLGFSDEDLAKIEALIKQPHGIILVTGPTGSGKTTTLYTALTALNDVSCNILTVEDPVEYYLPGISQTQVNTKVDMTFARGLRAILRQDPDVVMVGEIRDLETVQMAIQASLTGHLVLSTLHTNSAIGAITRLRDMGAEPFLISTTMIGVIAQRLVRVLCLECKRGEVVTSSESEIMQLSDDEKGAIIYHPVGCEQCCNTGYVGRIGIYEVIQVDEELRKMIHDNESEGQMLKCARQHSVSIMKDGWKKVLSGVTSIEEILRVT